jgi:hypothetical protein
LTDLYHNSDNENEDIIGEGAIPGNPASEIKKSKAKSLKTQNEELKKENED